MPPLVYLFVDNSNIFITSKSVAEDREGRMARDAVRLDFEHLIQLAVGGRTLAQAFVVGSIPPEQRAVWDRLTARTGIKPELYERGSMSGGEQGLDQCLQVHMLRAISDNKDPQVAVVLTGDGAGYDDGVGFHADLERMHAAGWGIEVLSWQRSCRRALREWATASGHFIRLDDYYDAITFIEGGRRKAALNLTTRPHASVRPGVVQQAEDRATKAADEKIRRLEAEMETLKSRKALKEARRERFQRRQERNANKYRKS